MNRRDLMRGAAFGLALGGLPLQASPPREATATRHRLPWKHRSESLHLAVTRQPAEGDAVLYVHGATFPSALSVGWRMQGMSWLDHLQTNGMDAWAFDFAGYGDSDRPGVFAQDAELHPPFGRHMDAASQIATVLRHIRAQRPGVPVHVIAHSWGTLPAQQVAIDHPELVSRLVLFGPPVTRNGTGSPSITPAWYLISAEQQRPRQRTGLPENEATPVSAAELERWCAAYLDSDATSSQRTPRSAKVAGGPSADIEALWAGQALVDSALIRQPTLIIRGEWDHVTTDADASRLFAALSGTRDKRDVKISGGNHWLHLQPRREALWAHTLSFLGEGTR